MIARPASRSDRRTRKPAQVTVHDGRHDAANSKTAASDAATTITCSVGPPSHLADFRVPCHVCQAIEVMPNHRKPIYDNIFNRSHVERNLGSFAQFRDSVPDAVSVAVLPPPRARRDGQPTRAGQRPHVAGRIPAIRKTAATEADAILFTFYFYLFSTVAPKNSPPIQTMQHTARPCNLFRLN